ncbi:MAG: hypothetical protein AAGJ18_14590 [Bacteroidota bacterium]
MSKNRFLKGLGYVERTPEIDWQAEDDGPVSDTLVFDLFRSKRTQNELHALWEQEKKEYAAYRATWVKQPERSYKIPPRK